MVTAHAVPQANAAAARASVARKQAVHEKARSGEDRYRMIAEAAYFKAERRGFVAGSELEDWLAAEIDIDYLLDEPRSG